MKVFDSGALIEDLRIYLQNADTCLGCIVKKHCAAFSGNKCLCEYPSEEFVEVIKEIYSHEVDDD